MKGWTRARGGNRGRGFRGGGRDRIPTSQLKEGLGDLLEAISLESYRDTFPEAIVQNVTPVSSYDWILGQDYPIIAVPGSPPIWSQRTLPFRCLPDAGSEDHDSNSRCSSGPLTPLLACVRYWNPEFEFHVMDVVSDRSDLLKLFRWAENTRIDDFRIEIQGAGSSTVLMQRWEYIMNQSWHPTYGDDFKRQMTRPSGELLPTDGHHRVITYVSYFDNAPECLILKHHLHAQELGGMRLLVRCHIDACFRVKTEKIDDLASLAALLTLSEGKGSMKGPVETIADLSILSSGTKLVPQANLIKVATKRISAQTDVLHKKFPQLALSGTPNLIIGMQRDGLVQRIERSTPEQIVAEGSRPSSQKAMRKLAAVLHQIQCAVMGLAYDPVTEGRTGRMLSLVCENGRLALYERHSGHQVPKTLLDFFDVTDLNSPPPSSTNSIV